MTGRILAVIPTCNRGDLITLTSAYLRRIPFDPEVFSFLISDDSSTEYGLSFLEEAYSALPNATFMRTSRNAGAVAHTWLLLRSFVRSDFDKIFIVDSDLIVHESCLPRIREFDADLLVSLYNSCFHEIDRSYGRYCTKHDIGWAGALIDKRIVEELFQRFGSKPFDDWALSEIARTRNLPIKVSTPSAIEHIGVVGANNVAPDHFDHSFDFPTEWIDAATREFFLEKKGIDLLRCLRSTPADALDADRLRVFKVAPTRESG